MLSILYITPTCFRPLQVHHQKEQLSVTLRPTLPELQAWKQHHWRHREAAQTYWQNITSPTVHTVYIYTYNYSIITINSSQNSILMNKILCSNLFTIDIICHMPPDIPVNNSISTRPNQFHCIVHTRSVSYTGTSTDISTILLLHYLYLLYLFINLI